jgi:hypothetical protein
MDMQSREDIQRHIAMAHWHSNLLCATQTADKFVRTSFWGGPIGESRLL